MLFLVDNLIVRRFLAFAIDLSSLLIISLCLAYLQYVSDIIDGVYKYYILVYFGYFFLLRLALKGNSLGSSILRIKIKIFDDLSFKGTRVTYRIILHISILLLFLSYLPIVTYIFPFIAIDERLRLLVTVMLVSLPILNFVIIFQSKGKHSFIDLLSGIYFKLKKDNINIAFPKEKFSNTKIFAQYIIITACIFTLALLLNWKYELNDKFRSDFLSSIMINPIERLNMEDDFAKYTESKVSTFSYILEDYNFMIPETILYPQKTLIVYVFLKEEIFDDTREHLEIIKDVMIVKIKYENLYGEEFEQSKVILRKIGYFPPFTFILEYKYIIFQYEGKYTVLTDFSTSERKENYYKYLKKWISYFEGEKVKFDLSYPSFKEAKPEFNLFLHFKIGVMQKDGLSFAYKNNKLVEFSQF